MYPKLNDQTCALHLAYMGSIKDEVVDGYELACKFVTEMAQNFPQTLLNRYGIDINGTCDELLERIGRKRGLLMKGNEVDFERVCDAVLDDFRKGRMGKITLDKADEYDA